MSLLRVSDAAVIPQSILLEYAGMDADATFRCYKELRKQLKRFGLLKYCKSPVLELSKNLVISSLLGLKIDRKKLKSLSLELSSIMSELQQRLFQLAGKEFNPSSPKQRVWFLFDHLGVPTQDVPRSEKTGQWSLNKKILQDLYSTYKHPAIHYLLEYSAVSKLQNTYVHPGISKHLDSVSRVHPMFNVAGAVTGRVLSREPPVATIPRDREYTFLDKTHIISLRDMFIADKGWMITYADVSQAELTVALIVAGEEQGLEILKSGRDFHNEVAWTCLGVPRTEKPSKDQRTLSKNIVFGKLLYGGSSAGVAAAAGVSEDLVEEAYQNFAQQFPKLIRFMRDIGELALQEGYLITPFGRWRRFLGHLSQDEQIRSDIRRQAQNLFCQNGAAEVVFRAFNRICKRFRKLRVRAWPKNIVYDSVIVEHPIEEQSIVKEVVIEELTRPVEELENYRFAIDVGQAESWGDAERSAVKVFPYGKQG